MLSCVKAKSFNSINKVFHQIEDLDEVGKKVLSALFSAPENKGAAAKEEAKKGENGKKEEPTKKEEKKKEPEKKSFLEKMKAKKEAKNSDKDNKVSVISKNKVLLLCLRAIG